LSELGHSWRLSLQQVKVLRIVNVRLVLERKQSVSMISDEDTGSKQN
jgi:hypothetical protein